MPFNPISQINGRAISAANFDLTVDGSLTLAGLKSLGGIGDGVEPGMAYGPKIGVYGRSHGQYTVDDVSMELWYPDEDLFQTYLAQKGALQGLGLFGVEFSMTLVISDPIPGIREVTQFERCRLVKRSQAMPDPSGGEIYFVGFTIKPIKLMTNGRDPFIDISLTG